MGQAIKVFIIIFVVGWSLTIIDRFLTFEGKKTEIVEEYPNGVVKHKREYITKALLGYFYNTELLNLELFYWENGEVRKNIHYEYDRWEGEGAVTGPPPNSKKDIDMWSYYNQDGNVVVSCDYTDNFILKEIFVYDDFKKAHIDEVEIYYNAGDVFEYMPTIIVFKKLNYYTQEVISENQYSLEDEKYIHIPDIGSSPTSDYSKSKMDKKLHPYFLVEEHYAKWDLALQWKTN